MVRLIIQFSGYNENGSRTNKKFQILNIEGDINMDVINKELEKLGELSSFRRNKEIEIFYMQAF